MMRIGTTRVFFFCLFLLIVPHHRSFIVAQGQSTKQTKEGKKIEKQKQKETARRDKEQLQAEEWEIDTRPPGPAYPASLRPEFIVATRQATLMMDNAFNSIPKSRMEFALANQSSVQAASMLLGSVQNEGERQVASLLYEYSQRIPLCQQLAWDSTQNVVTLLASSSGVRNCMYEARRLRATADRAFLRNNSAK